MELIKHALAIEELLAEAAGNYSAGDVVTVHSHVHGKPMDTFGKFNISKVTPTQLHVDNHKEGGIMKFSLKTLRGIGEHDHLLIKP